MTVRSAPRYRALNNPSAGAEDHQFGKQNAICRLLIKVRLPCSPGLQLLD